MYVFPPRAIRKLLAVALGACRISWHAQAIKCTHQSLFLECIALLQSKLYMVLPWFALHRWHQMH